MLDNNTPKEKDKQFLLKSKKTLDKLNAKISQLAKKANRPATALLAVQKATNMIQSEIQSKIEVNFDKILNAQTLVEPPMLVEKTNERIEGEKALIEHYWKKIQKQSSKKGRSSNKENLFPPLKKKDTGQEQNTKSKKTAIISSLNVKIYEKEKEKQSMMRLKEEKLLSYLYTYMVHVIEYKIQNDSTEFLMFQKSNHNKWEHIEYILKSIEKFCEIYEIKYCTLDLQKVLDLLQLKDNRMGKKSVKLRQKQKSEQGFMINYSPHELLGCLQNAEEISSQNSHKRGIRFYGTKGKIRAIIKIQSAMRGKIAYQTCKKIKILIQKVVTIQKAYKIHLNYKKTKEIIGQKCLQKYSWFTNNQNKFKSEYRVNELSKAVKYEIHISSKSVNQWQRFSSEYYLEKHNCEVTRIFRAVINLSPETRIIYVSPLPLPQQIVNYYFKLLELGGAKNFKKKIILMSPNSYSSISDKLSLTRILYYECKALKKIKSIVQGNYAYIVPSIPSVDYVNICNFLGVPLYSNEPQKLLHLQSKSGTKYLLKDLCKDEKSFCSVPFITDIYSEESFLNEFSNLIVENPKISRWILKIDNEFESRGIAQINIHKIIPKRVIKALTQAEPQYQNNYTMQIYEHLKDYFKLSDPLNIKISLLNKQIYRDPAQFFQNFLINGGIIEAAVNTAQEENQNYCVSIQIEPDQAWRILTKYERIEQKNKVVGCYFEGQEQEVNPKNLEEQIQVNEKVNRIARKLIQQKCFGYFSIEFIRMNQRVRRHFNKVESKDQPPPTEIMTEMFYFSGIKCYLDVFTSAHFMRQFINKNNCTLYIPLIVHENIKKINITTFFHLCRLQNMSFDIENKIGNIFMFVDGLESGCMGLMTFSRKSKIETFIHAAQVLAFFCNKLMNSLDAQNDNFVYLRSAINGFLKKKHRINNISKKQCGRSSIFSEIYC